ncbi:PAS domain S-box protein [bacterium]|nr:PAS domain S-box protein [bacterium]
MMNKNYGTLNFAGSDKKEDQLSAVMEIANLINSRLDLEHVLSRIAKEMARVIDYDIGCVAVYEKDDNCLYLRHIFRKNGDHSYEGTYVPIDESNVIGWVAINKKPAYRNDILNDNRFKEVMKKDNLRSDVVVPLMSKDSFIGTLNIGSYEPDHFSEFDLELVTNLSKLTSIAVKNSTLFEEVRVLGIKYKNLMHNAKDVITLMDFSGKIVECSDSMERISGYTRDEILGNKFFKLTSPERREESEKRFSMVIKGELDHLSEVPYVKKNGDLVYMDIDMSVIRIKDKPYVLSINHDITEKKILEEKIRFQNKELKGKNKKLMDLDRLKSEFLGRVSHELRTPLSVIMAYVDSLQDEDSANPIDKDTRDEFLSVISNQSGKLLGIINDLLDLSRVEISNSMLDMSQGSINEIVRLSVKSVEREARDKDINISYDLDESLPIINFDTLRIQQVCINLLSNAVKFTGKGDKIFVQTGHKEKEIIISISDAAPYIKSENIDEIFKDFTQIDGGSSRLWDGMGVGLRLVKHYVNLHGGRVWVNRRESQGNTFSFSIPTNIHMQTSL